MLKIKLKSGFTLIELLVTTTIMIVLTMIGLVSFQVASRNGRNAKRKSDMETVRQALVLYRSDIYTYPTGDGTATAFGTMLGTISDYLSSTAMVDPKNSGTYVYTYLSDTSTFTVCATLEPDPGTAFCINNP